MDIAVRLLLAIPLAMLLGGVVVFLFSLITGITNLVVLGVAKAIRTALRLSGSSSRVGGIGYEIIDLAKALIGLCLTLAIGWLAFVSFALERGPDLYTVFSTIAAALALFIWAPTIFVVGLFTGEAREAPYTRQDEDEADDEDDESSQPDEAELDDDEDDEDEEADYDDNRDSHRGATQVHFYGCNELHEPQSPCNGQVAARQMNESI